MVDKTIALHDNDTGELVLLLSGKSVIGCWWVFTVKYLPDGTVKRYKACLVAKAYTQTMVLTILSHSLP